MAKNSSLIVYILAFLIIGCGSSPQMGSKDIDAQDLKTLIEEKIVLIDVRTPNEFQQGRIQGATLIDFRNKDFMNMISKLDREKPVAIYCATGGRSTRAAQAFKELGFKTIYNYTGGFNDWKRRGEIIEK